MLESKSSVEYKDATATVLFVLVVATAFAMLFVTTPMLRLLEMVSKLVDLRCKNPDFFFNDEDATLPVAMSSLQRCG